MYNFLLLALGFSQSVLIKHRSEAKYLTTLDEPGKFSLLLTYNVYEAVDVTFSSFKDGLVFVRNSKEADKVFDIADNNVELIFNKYYGGSSQQFSINLIGSNVYNIMNKGKCLEYDLISMKILLNACTNSKTRFLKSLNSGKRI